MSISALLKELVKAKFVVNKTLLSVVSWKEKANHKVGRSKRFVARIKTVIRELNNNFNENNNKLWDS